MRKYLIMRAHQEHEHQEAENKEMSEYINKNGYHFTDELAEHVSKKMINANGMNHTWSVKEVVNAVKPKPGWTLTGGDLTYLANMAYSDFYPKVIGDEKGCIDYAIAIAEDPDGYEGQVFKRWLADVKGKGLQIKWGCFE